MILLPKTSEDRQFLSRWPLVLVDNDRGGERSRARNRESSERYGRRLWEDRQRGPEWVYRYMYTTRWSQLLAESMHRSSLVTRANGLSTSPRQEGTRKNAEAHPAARDRKKWTELTELVRKRDKSVPNIIPPKKKKGENQYPISTQAIDYLVDIESRVCLHSREIPQSSFLKTFSSSIHSSSEYIERPMKKTITMSLRFFTELYYIVTSICCFRFYLYFVFICSCFIFLRHGYIAVIFAHSRQRGVSRLSICPWRGPAVVSSTARKTHLRLDRNWATNTRPASLECPAREPRLRQALSHPHNTATGDPLYYLVG